MIYNFLCGSKGNLIQVLNSNLCNENFNLMYLACREGKFNIVKLLSEKYDLFFNVNNEKLHAILEKYSKISLRESYIVNSEFDGINLYENSQNLLLTYNYYYKNNKNLVNNYLEKNNIKLEAKENNFNCFNLYSNCLDVSCRLNYTKLVEYIILKSEYKVKDYINTINKYKDNNYSKTSVQKIKKALNCWDYLTNKCKCYITT